MQQVLRVEGGAAPDGRLRVTVTNTLTGKVQMIEVETSEPAQTEERDGQNEKD
jgi:hypothetical protein